MSRTYLAVRGTVRIIFWTTLAATPYIMAGTLNMLIPPLP